MTMPYPTLTAQQAFDRVLTHLREQGRSARDEDGYCCYRGPDGTMCAVGCLIPDELYDPVIEGVCVSALKGVPEDFTGRVAAGASALRPVLERINLLPHLALLDKLQDAHDLWTDLDGRYFEIKMRQVAEDFNLTYTPPTEGALA